MDNYIVCVCSPTGILMFGEKDADNGLEPARSSLKKCGVPYEVCGNNTLHRVTPPLLATLPPTAEAKYQ